MIQQRLYPRGRAARFPFGNESGTMIEKILLAYDGSDNGRRALRVAAELSKKLKAEL